ncbi:MAG: OmpA family protein [Bacteroidales bacterium]|nr:OmpA family protein [Bacteroidales bacterium]
MASKVRVYGKAQNRTVLGIINAYLVMYPHATLSDLRKAFPDSLNHWKIKGFDPAMFVEAKEVDSFVEKTGGDRSNYESNFFIKSDEVLKLQDGSSVAVNNNWSKEDFEKIVSWAKQYDIEVADFKPSKPFEQGGFTLEYLNGYVPPVPEKNKPSKPFEQGGFTLEYLNGYVPKNNSKWWLWLVLAAVIIIVLILLLIRSCNREPEVVEVEKIVTETVMVHDTVMETVTVHDTVTVYLEQIEEIEKNFNAAQFAVGKADLNDDAKFVLYDLVKILEKQPQVNLKIVGHTSDEGDAKFNQKLSENRAKAVVDFLISRGIAADRLQYEGKGSSEPLDPNNRDVNRRTQIIVVE